MIEKKIIDRALRRPIKSSPFYDKLIGKAQNWDFIIEKNDQFSDTYDTMQFIKAGVIKYHKQLKDVADTLKAKTIPETVENNYRWLYEHFQYSLDDINKPQTLYTPQRAWKERYTGFDCKTFSLLASILLYNQGIEHKIRKIKQVHVNPGYWSHVFVVVPHNKKELIIDATKHTNTIDSNLITDKYDVPMKNLQHQWLGNPGISSGLSCPGNCSCQKNITFSNPGLGLSIGSFNINSLFSGGSGIGGFLSGLKCAGQHSYDENDLKITQKGMEVLFNGIIAAINNAVSKADFKELSLQVNKYFAMASLLILGAEGLIKEEPWLSGCTTSHIRVNIEMAKFYRDDAGAALNLWLSKFFNSELTDTAIKYSNKNRFFENQQILFCAKYELPKETIRRLINYTVRPMVTQVPAFEITPYVVQNAGNGSKIDIVQLLNGLTNVVASFKPTTNPDGSTYIPGQNDTYNPDKKTDNAGFGVMGWVLLAAGAGLAFTQLKDKPSPEAKKIQAKNK